MNPRRRLVYFVVLNIFVSSLVTGAILFFYDRAYPRNCGTSLPQTTRAVVEVKVEITGVSGAGTVASETVGIRNDGAAPLILTGWTLKDDQSNMYTFPQLTLYPDGIVQVHTASGDDTASELHWDRSSPVWTSGELAGLYDAQDIARAFYRIP